MSREIDLSKRLSAADREYLDSRGRDDLIRQNEHRFGSDNAPTVVDDGNTGDVNPFQVDDSTAVATGMTPAELHGTPVAAIEGAGISDLNDEDKDPDGIAAPKTAPDPGPAGDPTQGEGGDLDDNYDDTDVWSYEDLKEEVKSREAIDIPLNSKREDLIAALRKDDATPEPEGNGDES